MVRGDGFRGLPLGVRLVEVKMDDGRCRCFAAAVWRL